jgi:hypothetical protein
VDGLPKAEIARLLGCSWNLVHAVTERELGVSKMSGSNIREAMAQVAQWGISGRFSGRRAGR